MKQQRDVPGDEKQQKVGVGMTTVTSPFTGFEINWMTDEQTLVRYNTVSMSIVTAASDRCYLYAAEWSEPVSVKCERENWFAVAVHSTGVILNAVVR